MDNHHLPPHQLSSDSTLSGWTLYPEQAFAFDYAGGSGGSYLAPHHVNSEQHAYQPEQIQYENCEDAYYVPAQTETTPQQSDLPPADTAISYWPTAQVPATDPVLSTTSMEPSDYFHSQWYYGNHDLSSTELHHHAAPVDEFQSMPHGDSTESYRGEGYPDADVSPLTAVTAPSTVRAIPAFAPLPTIAPHQSGSGHDLMPQDTTAHSALCEGAATFQTTDTSYAQMGLYENGTSGEVHPQYAPAPAQEQQQPYEAAYAPATQDQYVAPVPEAPPAPAPAPPPTPLVRMKRKASSESMDIRSRGRSPMGHLPLEEMAKARKSRRSSVFSGFSSSPSSTPRPRSPILQQTLTFITYPDLEPKGHSRGGECDGHGDDDDDGSPRRGRRGKKQPKKEPFLACFFCRGRKIACHPKNDGGEDKTCTQCAKRRLECKYPHTSRRGQRKPQDPTATTATASAATTTASKPRAARGPPKRSASSHVKI